MSNRPTGIDAPGMRDTLTVQDADTRKEKVVRLSDVVGYFDSLTDVNPNVPGMAVTDNGRRYFRTKNGTLIPSQLRDFRTSPISISATDALLGRNPFNIRAGIRSLPALTGTVIKFIDPSRSVNGTGTYADPHNDFPTFANTADNTIFCVKASTELNRNTQYGALKPGCSIIPYGHGNKPVIRCTGDGLAIFVDAGRTGIRLYHLHLESMGTRAVGNLTSLANDTDSNLHIVGCTIKMPGASRAAGTDVNGIRLQGANNKVIGCIIYDIPTDGIWGTGNNFEVAFNRIFDVAKDGHNTGDCVQIDSGSAANVHHNYLDRTLNHNGKGCLVLGNGTPNSVVEYNYMKNYSDDGFPARNVVSDGNGTRISRNFIIEGAESLYFGPNCTDSLVEGNIIVNYQTLGHDLNLGAAIRTIRTGANISIRRNTILGNGLARAGIATDSTTGTVIAVNNIIQGFLRGAQINSTAGATENSNCYFNNGANYTNGAGEARALGAKSLIVDPHLDENYIPQNPLVQMLGLAYDAGAAATTGPTTDLYGSEYINAMGAIQGNGMDFDEEVGPLYWAINGVKY